MSSQDKDWWRGAVIYQIYPRSFRDSNGDGIGDLNGVREKLDYIQELGVDGIWLSPFFKSPMRDFGYDVSHYCAVDPMFGSLKDFEILVSEAHARKLKVIIDQVWSHSSADHDWFQKSKSSRTKDNADWYVWADPKPDGAPPNNWQAWFGGPAWSWEPNRRQYYLHNFLPSQPDLNLRNPETLAAIKEVARFWLDRGVDGFRLDVVNYYLHNLSLEDNPPSNEPKPALPRDMQHHTHNSNQPETLKLVEGLREVLDEYDARMFVGEIAPGSQDLMQDYTAGTKRLHTAYAFDLLAEFPGVAGLKAILDQWKPGVENGWPAWALSNHDVARTATRWGTDIGAARINAAKLFLAFLVSLRGTIFLYQGEELGLPQAKVPFDKLQDPWGIAGWPTNKGRDGCRTPMPWSDQAGNTTEAWLPIPETHKDLTPETQTQNSTSPLNFAKQVLANRRDCPEIKAGALEIETSPENTLLFRRKLGDHETLCAFNFAPNPTALELSFTGRANSSTQILHDATLKGTTLTLGPFAAAIVRLS